MKKNTCKEKKGSSPQGNWQQFRAFFVHAKLSWVWIIIAIVVNIVYYLTVTKIPGSTAALFAGKFTTKAITDVVINYGLLLIMKGLVSTVILIAESKSVRSVRKAVWTRMMGIRTDFYDENSANHLLSTVTSDTEVAVTSLMNVLVLFPGLLFYLLKALPMINTFSPKLMWSVLILIPFYIIYAVLMGKWQFKVGMRIQTRIGGLTGYLTDRIRNLTMIKSFVTEEHEENKGIEASSELYKANIEYSYVNAVIVGYTILTEVIGIAIAVIWGCTLLRNGEINLESWLAFFLFVPTINTVLRQLTNIWSSLKDVQGRTARLGAMMEAPVEDMNENAPEELPEGDIRFEGVSFAYNESGKALKDVNLVIPRGKLTAIVGPSGSGKTTMLKLLEKLYSPGEGRIVVGDSDLSGINLAAWRRGLSYVNQGAEMFSGTIREVLSYGLHRKADDAELDKASKAAGIYDFIKDQPAGYDEEISIWGSTMSGGQRQRMVIARELLKNSELLLLDEPTSALDAETAASVSDLFFKQFAGKTVVAVTHELGFIANADCIAVMDGGRIVNTGTHAELMEKEPLYRSLVEEQSYQEVFEK